MQSLNAKENTVENYKRLINSSKAYVKYLETLGEENKVREECDIDSLKVGYATFALLLWKDEYVKKDKAKNLSTILVDKMLDIYIGNIATKKEDGTWQIGEISFPTSLQVLDSVRNKLAHGDFVIDKNKVFFEIEGQEGSIKIEDLVSLAVHLGNDWSRMRMYGENKQDVVRNLNALTTNNIQTEEDLEEALKNLSYVEITDKPKLLQKRTLEYMQMAYFLKDKVMKEIQRGNPVTDIPKQEHAKKLLDSVGMNATITEQPVTQLSCYEKIKGMYLEKLPYLKQMDPYFQQKYLAHWIHEAARQDMTKKSICNGLLSNQVYLKSLEKDQDKSVVGLVQNHQYGETLTIMNEKTILSAYIASFYFTYIYGLDAILNIKNKEYLPDIIEGKAFDFSKLDLSKLGLEEIPINKEYKEFTEQIEKLRADRISLQIKYSKVKDNLDKVTKLIEQHIPGKEQIYHDIESILNQIVEEQKRLDDLIRKCEEFMNTKYDLYRRNRAIIEHLRNSIAHGNVFLDIFQGNYTVDDAQIKFQDIHEGMTYFECKVSAKEFNSLTSQENLNKILSFLGEKQDEDSKKDQVDLNKQTHI